MSLEDTFKEYAAFGRKGQDTSILTGKNFAKLVKEKGLLDKKLTTTEVDMIYTRACGPGCKTMNFEKFKVALEMMGKSKSGTASDENTKKITDKILAGAGPSTSGTTKVTNKESVAKMTDTSKYTGSHKERFDESGKGKGLEGRKDTTENTGYVGAYKGKDTYDTKK